VEFSVTSAFVFIKREFMTSTRQGSLQRSFQSVCGRPMGLPTGKLLKACKFMTKNIQQYATKSREGPGNGHLEQGGKSILIHVYI
jgi:hypothetical protein